MWTFDRITYEQSSIFRRHNFSRSVACVVLTVSSLQDKARGVASFEDKADRGGGGVAKFTRTYKNVTGHTNIFRHVIIFPKIQKFPTVKSENNLPSLADIYNCLICDEWVVLPALFLCDSKHLRGFVCHEIFGNFFRHSEIFGLPPPPPPPPTIHASYRPGITDKYFREYFAVSYRAPDPSFF